MVAVDEEYVFEGGDGKATLLDLFRDRRQLVVTWRTCGPATPRSRSSPGRRTPGSCRSRRAWDGRCPGTRRTDAASTASARPRASWTSRHGGTSDGYARVRRHDEYEA